MSEITNKVSYIKGLADGLQLDAAVPTNKILLQLIDALKEVAEEVEILKDENQLLLDYIDCVSDSLEDVEQTLYSDEYDDFEDDYFPFDYYDFDENEELNIDKE